MTPRKSNLLVLLALSAIVVVPGRAGAGPVGEWPNDGTLVAKQDAGHGQPGSPDTAQREREDALFEQDAGQDTAHGQQDEEHGGEEKLDPVHHNSDAIYLDFEPFGKLELPRIFLVRRADGAMGLDWFLSTRAAMNIGGYEAYLAEGIHGTYLDAEMVPPLNAEVIIDFSITKHLVFAWISMLIVLSIFISIANRYKKGVGRDTAPKGILQNMMEMLVMFVRDDIARPNLGAKADRYLPYLLTVFFFILTCNLIGLIPYSSTATSNLMITGVLAAFTFVITQFGGTRDHWKHIFWPPGVPVMVKPILIPVELMGLFMKPFALAIRLFANMTAGHLVILSLIGLIFTFGELVGPIGGYSVAPVSVAFSLFISLLELLIAFIQAYVFTMLSALFIGMAVEEHHHEQIDPVSTH